MLLSKHFLMPIGMNSNNVRLTTQGMNSELTTLRLRVIPPINYHAPLKVIYNEYNRTYL